MFVRCMIRITCRQVPLAWTSSSYPSTTLVRNWKTNWGTLLRDCLLCSACTVGRFQVRDKRWRWFRAVLSFRTRPVFAKNWSRFPSVFALALPTRAICEIQAGSICKNISCNRDEGNNYKLLCASVGKSRGHRSPGFRHCSQVVLPTSLLKRVHANHSKCLCINLFRLHCVIVFLGSIEKLITQLVSFFVRCMYIIMRCLVEVCTCINVCTLYSAGGLMCNNNVQQQEEIFRVQNFVDFRQTPLLGSCHRKIGGPHTVEVALALYIGSESIIFGYPDSNHPKTRALWNCPYKICSTSAHLALSVFEKCPVFPFSSETAVTLR